METSYEKNDTNVTVDRYINNLFNLTQEDSNWIVTSSFMILTMQTGNMRNRHPKICIKYKSYCNSYFRCIFIARIVLY